MTVAAKGIAALATESPTPQVARHASWWRELVLPMSALAFLLAGATWWVLSHTNDSAVFAARAERVWYFGLVITGLPVVLTGARQAFHGQFATDLVASLSVLATRRIFMRLSSRNENGQVAILCGVNHRAMHARCRGRPRSMIQELGTTVATACRMARDGTFYAA